MGTLSGKVALVTGASTGIGRAAALALGAAGATVVITARRRERLESVAGEVRAAGGEALVVPGNMAQTADIERVVAEAERLGTGIDICVVNAGRGLAGGLLSSDDSQWRALYEINVLGAAALMRRVGERMVSRRRGDILVLGSVSGDNISPFSGFYGSSKFAIAGMAEAFRREVCNKGVRVTLLEPGIVESEFQEVAGYTPDNFYKGVARFGKLLSPADVAEVLVFVVTRPPAVHLNLVMVRPTGQDYP